MRLYTLMLVMLVFSNIACKKSGIPEKNFLSPTWAVFIARFPGGKPDSDAAAKQEAMQRSIALNQEAFALYQRNQDQKAIAVYEEALSLWASAEIYYNYGNSLSNIEGRLKDSIKAYQIALDLGSVHPELLYYNIACAFSRTGDMEKAFGYMALAVNRGYNAFEYIKQDPDLKALRQVPDWENKIKGLVPLDIEYDSASVAGLITQQGPRGPDIVRLCPNGIYWLSYGGWTAIRGRWHILKGDVYMVSDLDCSLADPTGRFRGAGGGGGDTFVGCRKADNYMGEPRVFLDKRAITELFNGTKTDYGRPARREPIADSRYCEESWRPLSAEDVAAIGRN